MRRKAALCFAYRPFVSGVTSARQGVKVPGVVTLAALPELPANVVMTHFLQKRRRICVHFSAFTLGIPRATIRLPRGPSYKVPVFDLHGQGPRIHRDRVALSRLESRSRFLPVLVNPQQHGGLVEKHPAANSANADVEPVSLGGEDQVPEAADAGPWVKLRPCLYGDKPGHGWGGCFHLESPLLSGVAPLRRPLSWFLYCLT